MQNLVTDIKIQTRRDGSRSGGRLRCIQIIKTQKHTNEVVDKNADAETNTYMETENEIEVGIDKCMCVCVHL